MSFIQPVVRYILDRVCEGKGYITAQARPSVCTHWTYDRADQRLC